MIQLEQIGSSSTFQYAAQKDEPRPLNAAGVRRRVIEGEGLGGFARRLTFNVAVTQQFLRPQQIFLALWRIASCQFRSWTDERRQRAAESRGAPGRGDRSAHRQARRRNEMRSADPRLRWRVPRPQVQCLPENTSAARPIEVISVKTSHAPVWNPETCNEAAATEFPGFRRQPLVAVDCC